MKQNDWIVANINNPNFSSSDFQDAGLSSDNTQMLSEDDYLKSKFITDNPNFKDDAGVFSKSKFDTFYKQTLTKFNDFSTQQDNFQYDIFNPKYTPNSRKKNYQMDIKIVPNPDHTGYGTGARDEISSPSMSPMELAETQKIFDTATQKFMDLTPNDKSLLSSPINYIKQIFSSPLVMAQWDDDNYHIDPLTGEKKKHRKGDYKLNSEGQYYTETLNGRNPMNKRVLSLGNLLTVDGTPINKYDFFDSDDIQKSTSGVIAKTVAAVVPLFIPYVDVAYGGMLATREILKTAPMLYGMLSSIFNPENSQSKFANNLQGFATQLSGDVSDYSKQSNFTFENIANMATDVALQWGQQKAIIKGIQELKSSPEKLMAEAENKAANLFQKKIKEISVDSMDDIDNYAADLQRVANREMSWKDTAIGQQALIKYMTPVRKTIEAQQKLGQDLSLVYMAAISNTDVYNDVLNAGASKREAALIALGSSVGMFSVDKWAHLGEAFFDDANAEVNQAMRKVCKQSTKEWKDNFLDQYIGQGLDNSKQGMGKLIKAGMELGKGSVNTFVDGLKNHTLGFFGKAFGEGLEEVSEEVVTDLSKELYQIAGQLGVNTSTKNVGAFNNGDIGAIAQRYFMNFLGGFMGGGIFYTTGRFQNAKTKHDTRLDEMIYLMREGYGDKLKEQAKQYHDSGKFGSTTLSALKTEVDENGNKVRITANDDDITENDYIYNKVMEQINQVDAILKTYNTDKSDDELFDQMILSDVRFRKLANYIKDSSYATKYQELYQNLSSKLVKITNDINLASATKTGTLPVDETGAVINDITSIPEDQRYLDKYRENKGEGYQELNNTRNANLQKLIDIKNAILGEIQAFHDGAKSMPYTDMLLFSMDGHVNEPFVQMNFKSWLETNYRQDPNDLSASELNARQEQYMDYKKLQQSLDLKEQFNIYHQLRKQLTPFLSQIQEETGNMSQLSNSLQKFFENKNWLQDGMVQNEVRLENETDEDFNNPEIHKDLINKHNNEIARQNIEKLNELLNSYPGQFVDPLTARYVRRQLGIRRKDLVSYALSYSVSQTSFLNSLDLLGGTANVIEELHQTMKSLNANMDNMDQIKENIDTILASKNRGLRNTYSTPLFDLATRMVLNANPGLEYEDIMNDPEFTQYLDKDRQIDSTKFIESLIGHKIDSQEGDIAHDFKDSLYEFYHYVENNMDKFETPDMPRATILSQLDTIIKSASKFNSYEQYLNTLKNVIGDLKTGSDNILAKTSETLLAEPEYNLLNTVSINSQNPIISLIKNLALYTNKDAKNIEELCQRLDRQFDDAESTEGFILEDSDKNDIQDALQLLRMAKAFVYGASTIANFKNPIGHNVMLNEFAQRNKVPDFEPLPQIDANMATLLYQELDKYINELDPNTFNSWSYKSNINEGNKLLQFSNAKAKFNAVKAEFWKLNFNSGAFKVSEDVDLLDGYNENMTNNEVENLFYDNVQKYLASGKSLYELFKSGLLSNIIQQETLYKQKSSRLDDRLDYAHFTSNDKLVYLMTTIGLRSDTFNAFLLSKVKEDNNIIPLDIQEYLAKVSIAFIKGKDMYDDLFKYLEESKVIDLPIFKNVLFVSGVGGSGKTMVVASYVKTFFQDSTVWAGAPAITQTTKLGNSLTVSDTFTKSEIINKIISKENYLQLKKDFDTLKGYSSDMINVKNAVDNTEVNKTEDAPDIFIIDEITHFSTLDLAILNKWAILNNVRLVTLGDESQSGYSDDKKIANIDTDNCFVTRTPKLFLSLRDANIQKSKNQKNLATILDTLLENIADQDSWVVATKNALTQLKGFNLHVYNQDVLNGDLFARGLDTDLISKIKDGTVGYLGDTNSDTFKMLKDNGINPTVFNSEQDLQGQEVAYMIIDPKLGFWSSYKDIFNNGNIGTVSEFLRKVYTFISRGQNGTIIIDKGGELQRLIGGNINDSTTSKVKSLQEVASKFKDERKAELEGLKLTQEPDFVPETSQEEAATTRTEDDINVDEFGKSKQDNEDNMNNDQIIHSRNVATDSPEPLITFNQNECRVYTTSIDGVEHDENGNWLLGTNNNDINIFNYGQQGTITTGNGKHELMQKLNNFKKDLLFRMNDFDNLHKDTKKMFLQTDDKGIVDGGRNAWKTAKFYIEIRPKNETDHLAGLTDLSNDKLADSNNLVYTVVMEFTRYDRKPCKLTLGLLPDINTYSNYVNNNTVSDTQKQNFLAYQALVKKGATKMEIERPKSPAVTYLIREKNETPIQAIRNITKDSQGNELPEELQQKSADSDKGVISFKERGRYITYSKPYVYMGGLDDVEYGLSPKCRGVQTMFVTDDPYVNKDELMTIYLQEKASEIENEGPGNRRVRLMPLNPRGLSFSDLINPLFKDAITTDYGTASNTAISHFPFDMARVGIKMYATLWNSRANLIQFITNAVNEVPDEFSGIDNLHENLAFLNYAKEQLRSIDPNEYNIILQASNQEQFRLSNGADYHINYDTEYAKSLGIDTNTMSQEQVAQAVKDNKISNYIYLSPDRAINMLEQLNNIINLFNPIIKISNSEGKDYSPTHSIDPAIPEGNSPVSENSISNLLRSNPQYNDGYLEIKTVDGDNAMFTYNFDVVSKNVVDAKNKFAGFKLVPMILAKAAKIVSLENAGKNISENIIKLYNKDRSSYQSIDLESLLSSAVNTTDFLNNMSLIFHGTTSAVSNTNSFRATFAPFKYGFRTYPILFMEESTSTKDKPFRKAATSDALFFTNVAVTSLFNITLKSPVKAPEVNIPRWLQEVATVQDVINKLDDKESFSQCKTLEDVNRVITSQLNDELFQDEPNVFDKVLGVTEDGKIIKSVSSSYETLENGMYKFKTGENSFKIFDGKTLTDVEENPLQKSFDKIVETFDKETKEQIKGLDLKSALEVLLNITTPDVDAKMDELFDIAKEALNNNENSCF